MIKKTQFKKVESIKKHIEKIDKLMGQLDNDIHEIVTSPDEKYIMPHFHYLQKILIKWEGRGE